ncbi:MAG TPA: ATP-binding protein [Streptosporangiaceae bacterium]|nr:ATP-binding protein [Streptosporangiaceae bacterium]
MDVKFCLVFPREALSVPVMRHVLGDTLRDLGADDDGVADLLLAVTEACSNVVRHGGPGQRYEVLASVGRGGCEVQVVNSGRGADAGKWPGTRLRRRVLPPVPAAERRRRRVPRPVTLRRSHRQDRAMTPDEAIAALPESGRGMAIMKACVDDVTLSGGPESGTVVSLQKRIAWRNDAPLSHLADDQLRDVG